MPQLLSKDRRILEREYLQSLPFGMDTEGKKIRDVGGLVVRANVEYLEELMVQEKNAHAGVMAVLFPGHSQGVRVHARITSPVWVLRHLSGKTRGLRILLDMERTSKAARRDGSTPKQGKLFLREP